VYMIFVDTAIKWYERNGIIRCVFWLIYDEQIEKQCMRMYE
jgi:hypothetical protein